MSEILFCGISHEYQVYCVFFFSMVNGICTLYHVMQIKLSNIVLGTSLDDLSVAVTHEDIMLLGLLQQ